LSIVPGTGIRTELSRNVLTFRNNYQWLAEEGGVKNERASHRFVAAMAQWQEELDRVWHWR
jgi:hypothetical protein